MTRASSFPLPRRGEVRYALARAAAILSSLLLLACAAPLHIDSYANAISAPENLRTLSRSIERDVNIYISDSLRHAVANRDPENLREVVRANEDVSTYVATTRSTSTSPSVSVSPSSSASPSTSPTPSISASPSTSATPSISVSPSTSASPSISPSPTTSATPTISPSPSTSATPSTSASPTTSATPSISASPSTSATPSMSASSSASVSPSASIAPTMSATPSASKAPSVASDSENHVFIDLSATSPSASVTYPGSAPTQSAGATSTGATFPASTPSASHDTNAQPPATSTSNGARQTRVPSTPLESAEPVPSLIPVSPDYSPKAEELPLPSPTPATPSVTPSPIVWVAATPISAAPSTAATPLASQSSSVAAPVTDPNAMGIQGMPTPQAGHNIVVFPILFQGSPTVSKKLDQCIRSLAAKRTNTTPEEWSLVGVRNSTAPGEIEARYAKSFSTADTEGVREFETYVKQSMSKDISNNCNINDVSIVGAGSIIAAVGVVPVVEAGGVDRTVALASSLGGVALLMVIAGVLAVLYGRRRRNGSSGDFSYDGSFTDSTDANNVPHVRPGLRFSSSRDVGPGPHTLVEAMGGLPIREIPMSEEGETVTTNTYTGGEDGGSTSIYDEEDDDRSLDFRYEGPSEHSLQAFTGAWGALAPGARAISEPDLDDEGNDADNQHEEDSGSSTDGFGDGGHPEPPSTISFDVYGGIVGQSESFGHPHDYLIGIGPTNEKSPLPPPDYVVLDLERQV